MALFRNLGNPEKKCILCGKAPGAFAHPAADNRMLCDKCAAECGYENAFLSSTPAEELTAARIERDWGIFARRMEENKEAYKAFKTTERFEKLLYLDGTALRFYAPSVLLSATKTPLVYHYHQLLSCEIVWKEDRYLRLLRSTDPGADTLPLDNPESNRFPVVSALQARIRTNDQSHPLLTLDFLEGETRKSSKVFEKACELAEELFAALQVIVAHNRQV